MGRGRRCISACSCKSYRYNMMNTSTALCLAWRFRRIIPYLPWIACLTIKNVTCGTSLTDTTTFRIGTLLRCWENPLFQVKEPNTHHTLYIYRCSGSALGCIYFYNAIDVKTGKIYTNDTKHSTNIVTEYRSVHELIRCYKTAEKFVNKFAYIAKKS